MSSTSSSITSHELTRLLDEQHPIANGQVNKILAIYETLTSVEFTVEGKARRIPVDLLPLFHEAVGEVRARTAVNYHIALERAIVREKQRTHQTNPSALQEAILSLNLALYSLDTHLDRVILKRSMVASTIQITEHLRERVGRLQRLLPGAGEDSGSESSPRERELLLTLHLLAGAVGPLLNIEAMLSDHIRYWQLGNDKSFDTAQTFSEGWWQGSMQRRHEAEHLIDDLLNGRVDDRYAREGVRRMPGEEM